MMGNEDNVGFSQYDVPTRPSWLVSTNPSTCCKWKLSCVCPYQHWYRTE